jgi:replicative DNA helicase
LAKSLDENDRLIAGTLPSDPEADAAPTTLLDDVLRSVITEESSSAREPCDLQAEAELFGALLWSGTNAPGLLTIKPLRDMLDRPEMAYGGKHRPILEVMLALDDAGAVHDIVSVHSELVRRKTDRIAGGLSYLNTLASAASTVSEIKARSYAQSIRDAWVRREALKLSKQIAEAASRAKSTVELVYKIDALTKDFSSTAVAADKSFVRLNEVTSTVLRKALDPSLPEFLLTGFRDVDALTGGLMRGEVTVLGARTSQGKSTMAAQLAFNICRADPKAAVLYISLEMRAERFARRLIAGMANVSVKKIRHKTLSPDEHKRLLAAAAEVGFLPLYFADSPVQTMRAIHATACKLRAKLEREGNRLALIVIDYIGLVMPAEDKKSDGQERDVAAVSRGTMFLANEHNCAILALSQIKRDSNSTKGLDDMPLLKDIRGSGAVENDADNVWFIHRPKDNKGQLIKGPAQLGIAKSRDDELGLIELNFDPAHARFTDYNG